MKKKSTLNVTGGHISRHGRYENGEIIIDASWNIREDDGQLTELSGQASKADGTTTCSFNGFYNGDAMEYAFSGVRDIAWHTSVAASVKELEQMLTSNTDSTAE